MGVTKGHQAGRFRIRADAAGVCRTQEDTPPTRFGTVRPRVQIPGPRPFSYSKPAISDVVCGQLDTAGSQFPTVQWSRFTLRSSARGVVPEVIDGRRRGTRIRLGALTD